MKKVKHLNRHVKSIYRLLSRRRVLMIFSFFAALCFAFADSASNLLQGESVRTKRETQSPEPKNYEEIDYQSNTPEPAESCDYEANSLRKF